MQVRRVEPGEHEAVGRLLVAAYAPYTLGPEDPYVARLADTGRRDVEAEVWVAVEGREVLGSVTPCPPGSSWREIAGDDEGEFRMLAVDPSLQGRGVGRLLVESVVERFRAAGCRAVVLSSLPSQTTAHRLYGGLDFERYPAGDSSPHPGVDLLAYRREL